MAKKIKLDDVEVDIPGLEVAPTVAKPKSTKAKQTRTTTVEAPPPEVAAENVRPAAGVSLTKPADIIVEDIEDADGGEGNTVVKSNKTISEEELLRTISAHRHQRRKKGFTSNGQYSMPTPPKKHIIDLADAVRYEPAPDAGLTREQIQDRYNNYYVNYQSKSNAKTYGNIFASNIFSFFNLLCIIVATALIVVGSIKDLTFMVIIMVNTGIGIFQECRSKRMIEKLSLVNSPTAVALRDGRKCAIPISEIVLDDILLFESGKQISSDCIVVRGEIDANESLLTGESVPVKKKVGDVLFAGSFVSSGTCSARVDKVARANYIAGLTSEAKKYRKPSSELMSTLRKLINILGVLMIFISTALLWGHYTKVVIEGDTMQRLAQVIERTSGAIIGMMPAGMFLLTSVALANSVRKLSKKKALVQDLYCIEMLARVDTLCLDKTGTITDGTMRVQKVVDLRSDKEVGLPSIIGSLISATEDNNQTAMALAAYFGYSKSFKPLAVLPFSSQRKFSGVTFEDGSTYLLGAPEFIMREVPPRVDKLVTEFASQGLRVLLLAAAQGEIKGDRVSLVRRPLAIIAIEDHIREDAIETIKWFKQNDVTVTVISGDNPITVSEVAKRVGIPGAELYISLEGLSPQEVIEAANNYTVFGRVTPEQKALLVKSMKAHGHTVAMTGDGVNDILALREADCSIAIASGSEAARNVSHLVLMNSNFNSMPTVVTEGRRVINNVAKTSSLYLMKTLFSVLLALTTIITFFMPERYLMLYPFRPGQLLMLEFFVIGIPSLVLAMQPNTDRIQGQFIFNVINKSAPGALALYFAVMAIIIYGKANGLANDSLTSMASLALTATGFVVLLKLCLPLNALRGIMYFSVVAGGSLAVYLAHGFFDIFMPETVNMLYLIIIIQASYTVLSIFIGIGNHFAVSSRQQAQAEAERHTITQSHF